jgi:uncharacterized protein with FMN-binding domain
MKRAPIILSATVAGVAATLGFQAHAPAATPTPAAQTASSSSNATASSSSAATTSTNASASATKTVTSPAVANQYGNVQLKVTVSGGKITKIEALQLPNNDPKSAQINAYAEPILQQGALTAQSAQIDAVSGATYTSNSYKTALQAALDKTSLASGSSSAAGTGGA